MSRTEMLLGDLPRDARVIEIGPSYGALVPKRDGWNTVVVDHASRDELVKKYAEHSKDTDMIEEVDHVWTGGSVADAIPVEQHGTFDAFIASHVIEHTTDVVTFLRAAQTLLKPDGQVILAVPDKRKCFDFYRHPSTTADAIVAYEERRDRHTMRTHIDYGMRQALKNGLPAWHQDDHSPAELLLSLGHLPQLRSAEQYPAYVDAHNWVFVPASFRLMVLELGFFDYLDLRIERWQEQPDTEFFVWLRPGAERATEDQEQRRRALLDQILIELAEQTRQLPGSPLWTPPIVPETPKRRRFGLKSRVLA